MNNVQLNQDSLQNVQILSSQNISETKKKRILILSDSVKRKTGYATVARNIIQNLLPTNKYEFGQLGLADIPILCPFNIAYYSQVKNHTKCCPSKGMCIEYKAPNTHQIEYLKLDVGYNATTDQKPCIQGQPELQDNYGFDSIYFVIQHFKPDIVIPINDLWGLYNIVHLKNRPCFKFIPYLAIDSECLFPGIAAPTGRPGLPHIDTVNTLGHSDKVIVFTDWAQQVIQKTVAAVSDGKNLGNLKTIPHGVDSKVWKPLENRDELRKKYFNIDNKHFLIGSVARNQPRKRLDATLMTMRKFIDKYEQPNKKIMCYFHCSLEDKLGWDLEWLGKYYNVADRLIFDKRLQPGIGPTDEQLNEIVNCFDVHLSLTNSEGWHLPALETAAAGIPNIITKYSAHADWGKDTLMFCKVAEYEHEPRTNFIKAIADTDHAAHQLNLLYKSKELCKDYKKKGVKLGEKLDWVNVCKQWEEFLDTVDISNLKEDRYSDPAVLPDKELPQGQNMLKHFPKEELNV